MLALIHIPKTAGTTLHKVLVHKFPPARTLALSMPAGRIEPADAERLQGRRGRPVELVLGHVGAELFELAPDARCVTVLRDPVARVVSHYHHARNTPGHYLHEPIHRHQLGVADYVAGDWSGEVRNGMVRMLAGMADFHHGTVDEETLATAIAKLDRHCVLAGLTERFDEMLVILTDLLGWRNRPYYIRRRVGSYRARDAAIDTATQAAIEAANSYDRQLYQHVGAKFEAMVRDHGPALAARVDGFRRRNRTLGLPVFLAREAVMRCGMRPWF
jgi:hypothetical protein